MRLGFASRKASIAAILVVGMAGVGWGSPATAQQTSAQQTGAQQGGAQQSNAQASAQATPATGTYRVNYNIPFGAYGGLALLMDVYRPANPNGFGALYIEGSGWSMAPGYGVPLLKYNNAGHNVPSYVKAAVDAGYTVFNLDHRAAPVFHYPAQIEDVQRAVRFVRYHAKEYGIDPAHIAAIGYSSGAHLASLAGLLDGDGDPNDQYMPVNRESARAQCVIAGATPADLIPPADYKNPDGISLLSDFIGEPIHMPLKNKSQAYLKLVAASPVHYVKPGVAPMLLIHGDADELTPYKGAVELQQLLEKANVPVKLITVKGGTHESVESAESVAGYAQEMITWLDQCMGVPRAGQGG